MNRHLIIPAILLVLGQFSLRLDGNEKPEPGTEQQQMNLNRNICHAVPDGQKNHYKAIETRVLDMANGAVSGEPDTSRLILVTCYPFDGMVAGGPLRYLVFAERNEMI